MIPLATITTFISAYSLARAPAPFFFELQIAQIVAGVVGAGFVVGIQAAAIVSYGSMSRYAMLQSPDIAAVAPPADSLLFLPARAALGNPGALALVLALVWDNRRPGRRARPLACAFVAWTLGFLLPQALAPRPRWRRSPPPGPRVICLTRLKGIGNAIDARRKGRKGRRRDEARFRDPVATAMVSKLDRLDVTSPIEALLPVFDRGHVAIVIDNDNGGRFLGLITRIDLLNYLRRRVQ